MTNDKAAAEYFAARVVGDNGLSRMEFQLLTLFGVMASLFAVGLLTESKPELREELIQGWRRTCEAEAAPVFAEAREMSQTTIGKISKIFGGMNDVDAAEAKHRATIDSVEQRVRRALSAAPGAEQGGSDGG
jgi:hypothetical protein